MTRPKLFGIVAGLVIVCAGIAAYQIGGDAFLCQTTIHREWPSPSGKTLVLFERDCGATTDFNTQVSLMPNAGRFSAETYPSFFSVHGKHDLPISWINDRQIEIAVPRGEAIYRQEARMGDVTIKYNYGARKQAPSLPKE